jgi:hypothetical protein
MEESAFHPLFYETKKREKCNLLARRWNTLVPKNFGFENTGMQN